MQINYLILVFCHLIRIPISNCIDTDFVNTLSNENEIPKPFSIFSIYKKNMLSTTECLENIGFVFKYKFDKLATYTYTAPACIYDSFEEIDVKIVYKNMKERNVGLLNIKTSSNIKIKNNNVFDLVLVLRKSENPYFIEISNVTAFGFEEVCKESNNEMKIFKIMSPFIQSKHKTKVVINNVNVSEIIFEPERYKENEKNTICKLLKRIKDFFEPTKDDLKNDFRKLARIIESNGLRCRIRCLYIDCCAETCPPNCYQSCSNKCYDQEWIRQNILYIRNRRYFEVYLTEIERSWLGCQHNIFLCAEPYDQIPNKKRYRIYYDPECKDPEYVCLSKIADELAQKYENDLVLTNCNQNIPVNTILPYQKPRENVCTMHQRQPNYLPESCKYQCNNQFYDFDNTMNYQPYDYKSNAFNQYGGDSMFKPANYPQNQYNTYECQSPCALSNKHYTNNQNYNQIYENEKGVCQRLENNVNILPAIQDFTKNTMKIGLLSQQSCDQNASVKNNIEKRVEKFLQLTKEIKDIQFLRYFIEVLCFCNIKNTYPEYNVLRKLDYYLPKTLIDIEKGLYYMNEIKETYNQILDQTGTSIKALMQNYPYLAPSIDSYLRNIPQKAPIRGNTILNQSPGTSTQMNVMPAISTNFNKVGLSNSAAYTQNLDGLKCESQIHEQRPFYVQQQGLYPCQIYGQNNVNQQSYATNNLTSAQHMQQPSYGRSYPDNYNQAIPFTTGQGRYQTNNMSATNQQLQNQQSGQKQINIGKTPVAFPVAVQPNAAKTTSDPKSKKTSTIVALPVTGEIQKNVANEKDDEEEEDSDESDESTSDDEITAKQRIKPKKQSKISSGAIVAIAITAVSVVIVLAGAVYYFLM